MPHWQTSRLKREVFILLFATIAGPLVVISLIRTAVSFFDQPHYLIRLGFLLVTLA